MNITNETLELYRTRYGEGALGINNKACASGRAVGNLVLDHSMECCGKFYSLIIKTERLSGVGDLINIMIPEALLEGYDVNHIEGKFVAVAGDVRVYRKIDENLNKKRSRMYIYAKAITISDDENDIAIANANFIWLRGKIYKPTVYRATPFGRTITDVSISVPRRKDFYDSADNIPCIAWGRNATVARNYKVGDIIEICGRIQSRTYEKVVGEEAKTCITWEISVSSMERVNN